MRISMQRAFVARSVFTLAMAAIVADAYAGDPHGYRTDAFVASNKNECSGVPSCLSTTMASVVVPANKRKSERFACPASHPNLWGWDSAQHEHITVRLIAIDRKAATLEGVNATTTAGQFMVSLGCSTELYTGSGLQQSRQLAPTEFMTPRKSEPKRVGPGPRNDNDVCNGIKDCQVQYQTWLELGGWASVAMAYTCQGEYPYPRNLDYQQTGSPSISAVAIQFEVTPGTYDVLFTNWNLFETDQMRAWLACSKVSAFGDSCGDVQTDPECPVISGTYHNYCSKGQVPICFQVFEERCSANNQRYTCTNELGIAWCQPCPG
jgi:hypothetical protein